MTDQKCPEVFLKCVDCETEYPVPVDNWTAGYCAAVHDFSVGKDGIWLIGGMGRSRQNVIREAVENYLRERFRDHTNLSGLCGPCQRKRNTLPQATSQTAENVTDRRTAEAE